MMENWQKSLSNFSFYNLFFYSTVFFLSGVLLFDVFKSYEINVLTFLGILLISGLFISLIKKYTFLYLILFLGLGFYYYAFYDFLNFKPSNLTFGNEIEVMGTVLNRELSQDSEKIILELDSPYFSKIEIKEQKYPIYDYGDKLLFRGKIYQNSGKYGKYLEKENILGTSNFPNLRIIKKNETTSLKSILFKIKSYFENSIDKNTNASVSALVKGLVLGETSSFSKDLKNDMKSTGTTHIVALSGYNVSMIELFVILLLSKFLKRKWVLWISFPLIFCFILMAGAPASLVRAGIMSSIIVLAEKTKRTYNPRNALLGVAFLMVLINPRILSWDLGFQLSFLAIFGLFYIRPILEKLLNFKNKGFLNWKDNLLSAVAAEIAVLGLLIYQFNVFSFISILVNILILPFIPIITFMGFLISFLNLFSGFLAFSVGLVANFFSNYVISVITFFAKIASPISITYFPFLLMALYYFLIIDFVYKRNKKPNNELQNQ